MSNLNYEFRVEAPTQSSAAEPRLREIPGRSSVDVAQPVRQLTPYEAVTSQAAIEARPDDQTVFKLDWNEATIPPSPRVKQAITEHMLGDRTLNWYPQLGSTDLCDALVDYTGLDAEHLLATNGSDDALHLICATYLDKGDEVVAPVPTYNHFIVFAQSRGADIVRVQGNDPFEKNLDAVHAAVTPRTRLVYLVSPNNPTGVVLEPSDVAEFCERYPDTLIVLDEAYYEFSQVTGIELAERYPNLIVTRTFSKAFGLAGLRVGYLASSPEIVDGLSRIYNPKSVNTLGQIGAIAALDDLAYLHDFLGEVEESKAMLRDFFADRDAQAHITPANFVVVRVGDIDRTLANLEERGVYVRDRSSYPGLEGCLRMSVGTVEQTERVIERIQDVF